jgi:Flp pilus assembly protein TadD
LGNLYERKGHPEKAEAEYMIAMKLWPGYVPTYVNLADLMRSTGRENDAEKWLLLGREKAPANADVVHALGLLRVRQHRGEEALSLLQKAAALAPGAPRYSYVYGVALYSSGKRELGLDILKKANLRFPADRDILIGLATMSAEAGHLEAAKKYAEQLMEVAPSDPRGNALLRQLERAKPQN